MQGHEKQHHLPDRIPSPPNDVVKAKLHKQINKEVAAQKALAIVATCKPENDEPRARSSNIERLNYIKGSVQHSIQIRLNNLRNAKYAKLRQAKHDMGDDLRDASGDDDDSADDEMDAGDLEDEIIEASKDDVVDETGTMNDEEDNDADDDDDNNDDEDMNDELDINADGGGDEEDDTELAGDDEEIDSKGRKHDGAEEDAENDDDDEAVALKKMAKKEKARILKYEDDKKIVMANITNDGSYLQYASDALKDDKEVVLLAVSKWGHAIKYASARLQRDKDVVTRSRKTLWLANENPLMAFPHCDTAADAMEKIIEKLSTFYGDFTSIPRQKLPHGT